LVARTNLFEGTTVLPDEVMVRPARPDELDLVNKSKDKLMPALVTAVNLRVLQRSVLADELLLKEQFSDLSLPDAISTRLDPDMRAVNVSVSKSKSLGGTVRAGEYVDVFLTSLISDTLDAPATLRTACIARQCKVILKRDSLYTQLVGSPEGVPVHFTLQANPYRAALIDFAQSMGQLSLRPLPMNKMANKPGPFSDLESKEFKDDESRVSKILKGELAISSVDLQRVFDLPPLMPLPRPTTVSVVRGTKLETVTLPTADAPAPGAAYVFVDPAPDEDIAKPAKPGAATSPAPRPIAVGKPNTTMSGYVDPKKNNTPTSPNGGEKKKGL
jgi:Flp pilus assembly protein CpaB